MMKYKRKGNQMKILPILLTMILVTGCFDILGSDDIKEIDHINFTVTSLEVEPNTVFNCLMRVRGTIENVGDTTILPPYMIEATFYSDSTFTEEYGSNYSTYYQPLEVGESNILYLFKGINEDIENFAIKDIRAYK